MEKINCHGEKNKKRLIENYILKPFYYSKLLANQDKQGCCGKLTDEFYIFQAKNRDTGKEFSFYSGKHCAERLLELIPAKPLRLFNPFKSKNDANGEKQNNSNSSGTIKKKMHPINEELIQTIHVIAMAWNTPPPLSIIRVIDFTEKVDASFTVNKNGVLWINNNLSKDGKGRTLSQIYSDLKDSNPTLKDFTFNNLRDYMTENYPDEVNWY